MKTKIKAILLAFVLTIVPTSLVMHSCDKVPIDEIIEIIEALAGGTGWLQELEDMDNIPEDITPFDDNTDDLSASVSLENKFPPIGNQEQYGTCVVWATGYNLKTALNAIEKGWGAAELANKANQTSPRDLWYNIPAAQKGSGCNGTNFEPALDALIAGGAESLQNSPYNMSNCSGTGTGNSGNKLANYRKIASETEGLTPENFKGYLNAGRPIAIGARLGDRFMSWKDNQIISYDTYNDPGMQHAYHAMVLTGYDDGREAFRVRNSWGDAWGDKGSIWVDYTFFCESFCFAAFVAQNVNSVSVGSGGISAGDQSNGYDLMAYSAEDGRPADPDFTNYFSYKVYNSGNVAIPPSMDWTVVYMLYNATDAEEYEVIFEDVYTDDHGAGDGELSSSTALAGGWWNNAAVQPGKMAGEAEYGPEGFMISYNMPAISGKYYLVVLADAYDVIREVNEDNNFYFITAANGKPLEFVNGEITNMSQSAVKRLSEKLPAKFADTDTQTPVKPGNLNAYTPAEIKTMLLHDKKSGKLDAKIKAHRTSATGKVKVKQPKN